MVGIVISNYFRTFKLCLTIKCYYAVQVINLKQMWIQRLIYIFFYFYNKKLLDIKCQRKAEAVRFSLFTVKVSKIQKVDLKL